MRGVPTGLAALGVVAWGCGVPAPDLLPRQQAAAEQAAPALRRAHQAAASLKVTIRAHRARAADEGTAAVLASCRDQAPLLVARVAGDHRLALGRAAKASTSDRPAWVAAWLEAHDGRRPDGDVGLSKAIDGPEGTYARVLVPLTVDRTCLGCHGARTVRQARAARSEQDAPPSIEGYRTGQILGAIWAEAHEPRAPRDRGGR